MSEFWKSIPTIQAERGSGYVSFPLFGAVHIAELAVTALFVALMCFIYRRASKDARRRILGGITVIMLADEILKYVAMTATGQWSWIYLPLHLCSINIFVCLANTLTGRTWCKEVLYALCIPGAAVALLSPSWQVAPVWNIMHLHSLSIHMLLLLYPILLLADGFRPQPRRVFMPLAFLFGTALPIYYLNKALGTNFYFINYPYGNALTKLFASWFGEKYFIIGFIPAIAVVLLLMYLPWVIAGRSKAEARINS